MNGQGILLRMFFCPAEENSHPQECNDCRSASLNVSVNHRGKDLCVGKVSPMLGINQIPVRKLTRKIVCKFPKLKIP